MYLPEVGSTLTVALPGESVRAAVARVVDGDTVLVELDHVLNVGRQHTYRVGDIVCVHREQGMLGEIWQAVDERRLPVAAPPKKKKKAPRMVVKAKRQRNAVKKRAVASKKAKRRAVDRT